MLTFQELEKNAIGDLKDRLVSDDTINEDSIADVVHEVTENWIPVHIHEVLQIALSNLNVVCEVSEL